MPKITFIDSAGTSQTVDGETGSTVMETAIKNGIAGIEAECGGACACATCHVYVDEAWMEKTGAASRDGAGHARFCLRRAADLAAVVSDQGDGRSSTGWSVTTPDRQA